MLKFDPATVAELRSILHAAYSVPSAEAALGFHPEEADAVLVASISNQPSGHMQDIDQVMAMTKRSVDEYWQTAGGAASASRHAAELYRTVAELAAHHRAAAGKVMTDLGTVRRGERPFETLTSGVGEVSSPSSLSKSVTTAVEAEAVSNARRARMTEDRVQGMRLRDNALRGGSPDLTALDELRTQLDQAQLAAERLRARAPGPQLGTNGPKWFGRIATATKTARADLDAAVKPAQTALIASAARDFSRPRPSALIENHAENHSALSHAFGAAYSETRNAIYSGLPQENQTRLLERMDKELGAVLESLGQLETEATRQADALNNVAEVLEAEVRTVRTEAESIAHGRGALTELERRLSTLKPVGTEILARIEVAAGDEATARSGRERVEREVGRAMEEALDAGDRSTLRRAGLDALPDEPAARDVVMKAVTKEATFALAHGDGALGSLDRGKTPPAEDVAQAAHAADVVAANRNAREFVPEMRALGGQTRGPALTH